MRKSIFAAVIGVFFFYSAGTAFAEFNPHGRWLLEGGGFAEKSIIRVELTAWGELYIQTVLENEARYVTGYDVEATLDATRFDINAWEYSASTTLQTPVVVPEAEHTLDDPFELPPVTYDGLTYKVTFTSATSGTIRIYGYIDNGIEINSISAIWKEGTEKPDIPDMTSGCDAGFGAVTLLLITFCLVNINNNREKTGL